MQTYRIYLLSTKRFYYHQSLDEILHSYTSKEISSAVISIIQDRQIIDTVDSNELLHGVNL